MNRQEIITQIQEKRSFLCIGLDTDIKKIVKKNKNPKRSPWAADKPMLVRPRGYASGCGAGGRAGATLMSVSEGGAREVD